MQRVVENEVRVTRAAFEPFEPLDDALIYALPTRELLDIEPIVGRSPTAGSDALAAERGPAQARRIATGRLRSLDAIHVARLR